MDQRFIKNYWMKLKKDFLSKMDRIKPIKQIKIMEL